MRVNREARGYPLVAVIAVVAVVVIAVGTVGVMMS